MAELVDALDLGSSGSNPVEVRPLFPAPCAKIQKIMNTKHQETKGNTAKIILTANTKDISTAKEEALIRLKKNLSVKGFRQGKVPSKIAEKEIGQEKLNQEAANQVLESGIRKLFQDKTFNILGLPQLDAADTDKKDTWTFTLSLPLKPEIKLGDYKKLVKETLKKAVKKEKDQKTSAIVDALIAKIKIVVPQILIEREINTSLSRLVQQTESLNLDLNTYLKSVNKTPELLKKEYAEHAEKSIQIDLILSEISKDLKIKVTSEEVKSLAKTSQTPEDRQQSLVPIIARRKTLDHLLSI
jgi:FKBP-type peptidyl-prolyl cis-trans isomerase (trigger factor)